MIDVIQAVIDILSSDTGDLGVATLTQGRIYDSALAESEDFSMPDYAVVLRFGGGPGAPFQLQLRDRRVNILCYGPSDSTAEVLHEAVEARLRAQGPQVQAGTYLHWINPATGPISMKDPVTEWPYVSSSWLARASTITIGI
jgi:hypothetical protein